MKIRKIKEEIQDGERKATRKLDNFSKINNKVCQLTARPSFGTERYCKTTLQHGNFPYRGTTPFMYL